VRIFRGRCRERGCDLNEQPTFSIGTLFMKREDFPGFRERIIRDNTPRRSADGWLLSTFFDFKSAKPFLKVRILLQFQNFSRRKFGFRRVTLPIVLPIRNALRNESVPDSKCANLATKETFQIFHLQAI
jgi:hypothetical protein